jgi:hypothetical protein
MSDNPHRARLVAFYNKYNPEKLDSVDSTLDRFKGDEAKMFEMLVTKYGPEPVAPVEGVTPAGLDHRARLIAFYEQHQPEKVSSVDATLEAFKGKEDRMYAMLAAKYNVDPATFAQ